VSAVLCDLHFFIDVKYCKYFTMEIVYVYTKKRAEFGRQCAFNDRPAELHCDIVPDSNLAANFIVRSPIDRGLQSVQEMSEHQVRVFRLNKLQINCIPNDLIILTIPMLAVCMISCIPVSLYLLVYSKWTTNPVDDKIS